MLDWRDGAGVEVARGDNGLLAAGAESRSSAARRTTTRKASAGVVTVCAGLMVGTGLGVFAPVAVGQEQADKGPSAAKVEQVYKPIPGFDVSSIDGKADPCNDFYKFACGHYEANHPIPADQTCLRSFLLAL